MLEQKAGFLACFATVVFDPLSEPPTGPNDELQDLVQFV